MKEDFQERVRIAVLMGSKSDLRVMQACLDTLRSLQVAYEAKVVSAHRTPRLLLEFAEGAAARGLHVIIAGAGGAAHLPGMLAASTTLPVLGVPVAATPLAGVDALLSIAQMPRGVPVGTLAVDEAGAINAALLAAQILALHDPALGDRLRDRRQAAHDQVLEQTLS